MIRGPLTAELNIKDSPVRRFLDERFTSGLRDVQRRYRQASPALVVPSADRQEANPGTVGTAADWLLRFMLHPRPSLKLAAAGAAPFPGVPGQVVPQVPAVGDLDRVRAAVPGALEWCPARSRQITCAPGCAFSQFCRVPASRSASRPMALPVVMSTRTIP